MNVHRHVQLNALRVERKKNRVVDVEAVLEALERNKRFLRGEIARHVNLKFAPDIRFHADERFAEAERIEKLLRTPAVQKDLAPDSDDK